MQVKLIGLVIVVVLATSFAGCRSPYYRDRGALLGGLTGSGIGAAIGENNDEPLVGALIGGAVGTVAGAALGDGMDAEVAHNNAIIEQQMGQRLAGAVTTPQVIAMSQAQLSEDVMITHIRANGVAKPPTSDDLINLKNQGVSDRVINAMQNQPPIDAVGPHGRPIIVEEHHYYDRPGHYSRPWRYRHHHHRHGPGWNWGISIGR